ncbi:hypothetical protein Tco_1143606, partial [Tanacetum coccineum]
MALQPRDQRHQYLRYEGLQYTEADIEDFESRLARIYKREIHRVQVFDFGGLPDLMAEGLSARMLMEHRDAQGVSLFTSRAWRRLFDIRGSLVHELILEFFSTFRFGQAILDLDTPGALQFQLGRARRRMSGRQFILDLGLWYETDITQKDKKQSQKRQNRAGNGKDKVKSKPKSVKVKKSTGKSNPTKSKVNQMKKIQLEGLKLPNLKLYYKNKKTRAEIANWVKYNFRASSAKPLKLYHKRMKFAMKIYEMRDQSCQLTQNHFSRPTEPKDQSWGLFSPFTLQPLQPLG